MGINALDKIDVLNRADELINFVAEQHEGFPMGINVISHLALRAYWQGNLSYHVSPQDDAPRQ
jgi:hypothetical protein